jgi:glucose-6-phosphate isomerase
MKQITLDFINMRSIVEQQDIGQAMNARRAQLEDILHPQITESDVLGWVDLDKRAPETLLAQIEAKAQEIRENADTFLLIGVGGSNQGARAVIKAFQTEVKPEILYTGNNLSPYSMNQILEQIKGKSVYVNIIAKNFATLEPGICFRMVRKYLEATYGSMKRTKSLVEQIEKLNLKNYFQRL